MFDQLFKKPETLARHRAAPLLEERLAFLAHQAGRGVCPIVLQGIARDLILVATALDLVSRSGEVITRDEIKRKAPGKRKRSLATRWLRFLGRLQVQPIAVNPYADQLKAFAGFMNLERGLSPSTIGNARLVPDWSGCLHQRPSHVHSSVAASRTILG